MFLSFRVSKSSQRVTLNQITNYPPEDISAALEPATGINQFRSLPRRSASGTRAETHGECGGWLGLQPRISVRSIRAALAISCQARRLSSTNLLARPACPVWSHLVGLKQERRQT